MIYGKVIERCLYCEIHIVFVCRQNTRYSGFIVILTTDYKQNRFTPIIAHHKGKPRNKAKKYRLPLRGKLLAKQGDEGGNLFSARMSLNDIATAPHQSTLLTASPQGEAKK